MSADEKRGSIWRWQNRARSLRHRFNNQFGQNRDAVFIWIPKSAGTSVYNSLEKLGCPKFTDLRRVSRVFPQRGLVTFAHMDYAALVKQKIVSQQFDQSAKKFTIVRDPYDRAVSLYLYIRDRHRHFAQWHKTPDFVEFLELVDRGFCEQIGTYNFLGMSQANPQIAWTRGIDLDYTGRLDALDQAMDEIGKILGRELPPLEWLNKAEKPQSPGILGKEERYLIDKIYDEDFATFGFEKHG